MAVRHFFVDDTLQVGACFMPPKPLKRRWHSVLRLPPQTEVILFNKQGQAVQGTWDGETVSLHTPHPGKDAATVTLMIGLPKRDAMDRILRQATELNVAKIQPVLCQYSVPDKLNLERAEKLMVEAAEQCERLSLPTLLPPVKFAAALKNCEVPLYWAYERGETLLGNVATPCAVLVGPEGGFSGTEVGLLREKSGTHPFMVGDSILRSDTAVVAALGAVLSRL